MKYTTINETQAVANWTPFLNETFGETNEKRISWMSIMAENKMQLEHIESASLVNEDYGSFTPNMIGSMGNPTLPSVSTGASGWYDTAYSQGTGDTPTLKLGMSMHVARYAFALDLFPVIPIEKREVMFSFVETIYGNGKFDDAEAQPLLFRLGGGNAVKSSFSDGYTKGDVLYVIGANDSDVNQNGSAIECKFYKTTRFTGELVLKFEKMVTIADVATAPTVVAVSGVNVGEVLAATDHQNIISVATAGTMTLAEATAAKAIGAKAVIAAVDTADEQISEFTNSDGISTSAMDRSKAEKGTTNSISLRTFTKATAAKTREVLATVTKQQIKDMGKEGLDARSAVYKAAQNVLVQALNDDLLDNAYKLGVTSHATLRLSQGLDLNLLLAPGSTTEKDLSDFAGRFTFVDVLGNDRKSDFTDVPNAETNSAAENLFTRQARLAHRITGAADVVSTIGRYGRADWAVVNTTIGSAIKNAKNTSFNPLDNTISQDTKALYMIGEINGIKICINPSLAFDDNRVLLGLKGNQDTPGVKFLPYDLVSSIETIEGSTMAPKIAISSDYAIVAAGMRPEAQYLTFVVDTSAFGPLY